MKNIFVDSNGVNIDNQTVKILSGAIHYFRIHPTDWYHSLYNLKALGFNTVETYVPWNLHEQYKGNFNFSGLCDIKEFIELAQKLDLYVIVRPSPYICAEWEYGGLPGWLLKENVIPRADNKKFISLVERYYEKLFKILRPLQITQKGPIIMMQIENEYGSFGQDKDYLKSIKKLLLEQKVTVPLCTSDGGWLSALEAGGLSDSDVLTTVNFGSDAKTNFYNLKEYQRKHHKESQPLMCMEFWDGWFNRWGEPLKQRETEELIKSMRETIEMGSINLYMFHGGTNFGFMNGCSARKEHDLPQITSYDYGAPLDEQGNPTEKYFAIKKLIHELFPKIEQKDPLIKNSMSGKAKLKSKVSLFNIIEDIGIIHDVKIPTNIENLNQFYGYTLYQTNDEADAKDEKLRIIDARDRIQVFVNQQLMATQYQEEIGDEIEYQSLKIGQINEISILTENMGRVNYGHKLLADTQKKGIRTGVMKDLHFLNTWRQIEIDFTKLSQIDFEKEWEKNKPAFYKYIFESDNIKRDTFLDMRDFGKGIVFINGFNIGRFWKGPVESLYVPHGLLKNGENEIIVFETEGIFKNELDLVTSPLIQTGG